MLMLSQTEGSQIMIGSDIIVAVTKVKGGQVKLGIQAPANVKIIRLTDRLPKLPIQRPRNRSPRFRRRKSA